MTSESATRRRSAAEWPYVAAAHAAWTRAFFWARPASSLTAATRPVPAAATSASPASFVRSPRPRRSWSTTAVWPAANRALGERDGRRRRLIFAASEFGGAVLSTHLATPSDDEIPDCFLCSAARPALAAATSGVSPSWRANAAAPCATSSAVAPAWPCSAARYLRGADPDLGRTSTVSADFGSVGLLMPSSSST